MSSITLKKDFFFGEENFAIHIEIIYYKLFFYCGQNRQKKQSEGISHSKYSVVLLFWRSGQNVRSIYGMVDLETHNSLTLMILCFD